MSSDLLKTLTVSLTSSFCTALFVVACTAGAEKPPETSADDGEWGSYADDDGGPGGDDDAAALAALELRVAELELRVAELEDFQSSALCFIGHMTDDQTWSVSSNQFITMGDSSGQWEEGPNSDAMKAYEDCF